MRNSLPSLLRRTNLRLPGTRKQNSRSTECKALLALHCRTMRLTQHANVTIIGAFHWLINTSQNSSRSSRWEATLATRMSNTTLFSSFRDLPRRPEVFLPEQGQQALRKAHACREGGKREKKIIPQTIE